MTEAPKCDDCRRYVRKGELRGVCGFRDAKYWQASTERRLGNCGPRGEHALIKEVRHDRSAQV